MSEITIQHAVTQLAKKDKILKKLIKTHGECTLKPLSQPHYHVLVWAIINQQLSVKAAASIETKLKTLVRSETFEPQLLLEHPEPALKQCGLSRSKIRYIHNLADNVLNNQLNLDELPQYDDETVSNLLMQHPGIGRWTADMFLMFSLGRLDILPIGDLALRKSIQCHYQLHDNAGHDDYLKVAERWQPYRTVASWYLWAAVD